MAKIEIEYHEYEYDFCWLFRKNVLHLRVRQVWNFSRAYEVPLYKVLN